jgi:parallel beta helix pectate lyase-like protein
MFSMIRTIAKLCTVFAAGAAILPTTRSYADSVAFVSSTGSNNNVNCTFTQPCLSFDQAIGDALSPSGGIGRVICLSAVASASNLAAFVTVNNQTLEIDCPLGGFFPTIGFQGKNNTGRLRNMTFPDTANGSVLTFPGSGTLILENCSFVDDSSGVPIDLEPTGPLNVVIRNSRISNSASGILLKPAAGGSIKATLDHIVVTANAGGGIKVDTTNGAVTVDITDSVVSNNGGNGLNAVGGAGGPAMFNISRSVIAKNAVAGIQVNGATAAAMIDTTLLDSNASGATSVVAGGHMLTYGNNRIVGTAGSGFTGSAALQ